MLIKKTIMILGLILLSLSAPAYAQTDVTRQFSKKHGKQVNKAIKSLNSDDYTTALKQLDKTLERHSNLNPYEKSTIFQMKGVAHYELNQIVEAIQAFEDAINAGGLLDDEAQKMRLIIAQLWIGQGEYERGAKLLEQWAQDGNALENRHIEILVQSWVQSENSTRALPWAEKWLENADPKERKHYDLMNFLYNNLSLPDKQLELVKEMIERWPDDKTLWDALASAHANHGRERDAFEVARLYYLSGRPIKESEILNIVQYHSYYKMPYDAARILEKEIAAGRVSRTPRHLVWLSILYQEAKDDDRAETIFAEAIEMRGEPYALSLKETLEETVLDKIPPSLGKLESIPEFKAPKIDRTNFRIMVSDRDAQPLVRVSPVMPQDAKTSGYCRVRFNVNEKGQPENITTTFCTKLIFQQPAIESVEKWKYNPKIVQGRAVARSGVENIVKFRLRDEAGNIISRIDLGQFQVFTHSARFH